VDSNGTLTISFSEEMLPVSNLTLLNNGTIEVEGKQEPVIDIRINPG